MIARCIIALSSMMLAAVAGCGLSDYEKQLDEQNRRLKEMDRDPEEEAKSVENPLTRPRRKLYDAAAKTEKEVEALPSNIQLQPPKGIATKHDQQQFRQLFVDPEKKLGPIEVYCYPGKDGNRLCLAGARFDDKKKLEECKDGVLQTKDQLKKAVFQLLGLPDKLGTTTLKPPVIKTDPPITVHFYQEDAKSSQHPLASWIHWENSGKSSVLVIFQAPLARISDSGWNQALYYSIRSMQN